MTLNHILLIDDDVLLGQLITAHLTEVGIKVNHALTAKDGLKQAEKKTPGLILLDMGLPDLDGLRVLKKISQIASLSEVPVIMLTARNTTEDVLKALTEGATDYIAKPFNAPTLVAKIQHVLARRNIKILIADDDNLLRQMLSWRLRNAGFSIVEAVDGEDALEKTKAEKPNLLILDGMMPGMDGLTVLHTLREMKSAKDIPILMLTARRMENDIVGALRAGANDYMTKPFMPEELMARIERLLNLGNAS